MAVKRIKDRIDGNEIDFSLSELTEVPEKDLANYPKATHVDLSRNHLALLSPTFAQLKHIVKLDLSKNSLTELPLNFGQLHKLQQLDLYGNKLAMLPVSFCNLRSLKWLDLKDNPLDKQLATASGDCLDEKQCQASAKNVVAFMQAIQSQLDREKQKRLKEQRGQEMKLKAAEEEEKLRKRLEKKSEKERRKQEHMSRKLEQSENLSSNHSKENAETIDKTWKGESSEIKEEKFSKSSSWCSFSCLLTLIVMLLMSTLFTTATVIIFEHITLDLPFNYVSMSHTFWKYFESFEELSSFYFEEGKRLIDMTVAVITNYYKSAFKT